MARMGYLVTAVDFSQEALVALDKAGQKENLAIETIKGSYTEALFNKNTFDAVLSYNVLYHGTRLEFMKSMEICKSYIKPSGILFLHVPLGMMESMEAVKRWRLILTRAKTLFIPAMFTILVMKRIFMICLVGLRHCHSVRMSMFGIIRHRSIQFLLGGGCTKIGLEFG